MCGCIYLVVKELGKVLSSSSSWFCLVDGVIKENLEVIVEIIMVFYVVEKVDYKCLSG